jgi:mediator of RNA polymerase II transcription subunit 17
MIRKETASAKLEDSLRRIFLERGTDFFERKDGPGPENTVQAAIGDIEGGIPRDPATHALSGSSRKIMTVEDLSAMRSEILPQLLCVFSGLIIEI